MAKKATTFEVSNHILVPKHTKITQKEAKQLFEKHKLSFSNLPQISMNDSAIKAMKLKEGDIVKIERASKTANRTIYYRGVINE